MDAKKKKILKALEKHKGIVTYACESLNMPRSTFYNWINEDEEFKKAVNDIQDIAIDYVEKKLFEKIEGVIVAGGEDLIYKVPPSDTAIIFYLKTKAKKRGYIERSEITGKDGEPVVYPMNDNQVDKIINALRENK